MGVPSVETSPSARQAINEMLDAGRLDRMMDQIDREGLRLTGSGGFLPKLIKAVLERGRATEQTEHLGYEKGDPAGRGSRTRATALRPRPWPSRSATFGWTCRETYRPTRRPRRHFEHLRPPTSTPCASARQHRVGEPVSSRCYTVSTFDPMPILRRPVFIWSGWRDSNPRPLAPKAVPGGPAASATCWWVSMRMRRSAHSFAVVAVRFRCQDHVD